MRVLSVRQARHYSSQPHKQTHSASSRLLLAFVLLFTVACADKTRQADTRAEQMQAQLDQAKKEIEDLKKAAVPQVTPSPQQPGAETAASRQPAPQHPASSTPSAKTQPAPAAQSAVEADLAASKAAAKKAIGEDRAAIAANRAEIDANRSRIDDAQKTAEEARRMAAPPPTHTIPAGTSITVRTTGVISTKTAATGSTFEATLAEPLIIDGYTVASKGATVEGTVTNADPGGRVKGVASITLGLRSVVADDGRSLPLRTDTVSQEAGKSRGKDAKRVGIATGIGAAIGAIAGGGKGAAIGAGAGAAGGTGVALATRGQAAEVPAESSLTFSLTAPLKVQEMRK